MWLILPSECERIISSHKSMAGSGKHGVTSSSRRPQDLADAVYSEIRRRTSQCPSRDALIALFDCLYFASLRTEGGEPITIDILSVRGSWAVSAISPSPEHWHRPHTS